MILSKGLGRMLNSQGESVNRFVVVAVVLAVVVVVVVVVVVMVVIQLPYYSAANCRQHLSSSGPGQSCANHIHHIESMSRVTCRVTSLFVCWLLNVPATC